MEEIEFNHEEVAILALAQFRERSAGQETLTRQGGRITKSLRDAGVNLTGAPEAILEMVYWQGLGSGLRAAHSREIRLAIMEYAQTWASD
jgi:hypothetical protein